MQRSVQTTSGAATLEEVLIEGNLARLTPEQRVDYYRRVCESAGLNPLTPPFDYLTLNGKLVLYCNRAGTDQLRLVHGVSVTRLESNLIGDVYVVTANGQTASGRTDAATGAVPIAGLKGESLANAYMKAETKAKRRLTLSLSGLGFLDESEVQTIPTAQRTDVDRETGEVLPARQINPPQPVQVPPALSQADVADLHAQFTPVDAAKAVWTPDELVDIEEGGVAPTGGMTSGELFNAAEAADVPKSLLTLTAKTMFGVNRWKITDLTDEERAQLWEEVAPVPA